MELTEQMLVKLSRLITSPDSLRDLASLGLGIPNNIITKHLTNERGSITEAAFKTLQEWDMNQEFKVIAHREMCEALRKVKKSSLIREALQGD